MDYPETLENIIFGTGHGSERKYHDIKHYAEMGGGISPELHVLLDKKIPQRSRSAITRLNNSMEVAGLSHDLIQMHLTEPGESVISDPMARKILEEYLNINDEERTISVDNITHHRLGYQGTDLIAKMAITVFNITPDKPYNSFSGGNEFASALLHGIERFKQDVDVREILTEMTLIAATIPFGKEDSLEKLERNLLKAGKLLPEEKKLSERDIMLTMLGSADLANRDVANFQYEPYAEMNTNSRLMLAESGLDLNSADGLIAAADKQVKFLNFVIKSPDMRIYHAAHDYPETHRLKDMEKRAYDNIATGNLYMDSIVAATAIVAASHVKEGGNIDDPIATMVEQYKGKIPLPDCPMGHHDDRTNQALEALRMEDHAFQPATRFFAANLLEELGAQKIHDIAQKALGTWIIAQPDEQKRGFSSPDNAQRFLKEMAEITRNSPFTQRVENEISASPSR